MYDWLEEKWMYDWLEPRKKSNIKALDTDTEVRIHTEPFTFYSITATVMSLGGNLSRGRRLPHKGLKKMKRGCKYELTIHTTLLVTLTYPCWHLLALWILMGMRYLCYLYKEIKCVSLHWHGANIYTKKYKCFQTVRSRELAKQKITACMK